MEAISKDPETGTVISTVSLAPGAAPPTRSNADPWWQPRFDRGLIEKYDTPIPRYTSYPTAPIFSDSFGPADYRELLQASAETAAPLSLYVHVPFCPTRCFFCGCTVEISRRQDRAEAYLHGVTTEIDAVAGLLDADRRPTVQIHWGGGTPTSLTADQIRTLGDALHSRFQLASELEFGVEIDPRGCTEDQLDAMTDIGVNRLSLGVQDLDPKVQAAVNRVQPLEQTRRVVEAARRRGIDSLNVDLIYGLPFQTPRSFAETIDQVVRELDPDRIAVFNFAYLPQMLPHQRVIDPADLPSPADKLTILESVVDRLTETGYLCIGLDHFAKPDDPLSRALKDRTMTRNFQGYSTFHGVDLVAFGASGIGKLGGGYAQNERTSSLYERALGRNGLATVRGWRLSAEDELRAEVIRRLMAQFRLDKATIEATHGLASFDDHFAPELARLEPLADDGLVEVNARSIEVTPLGHLLVRNVAAVFDKYLGTGPGSYSRAV